MVSINPENVAYLQAVISKSVATLLVGVFATMVIGLFGRILWDWLKIRKNGHWSNGITVQPTPTLVQPDGQLFHDHIRKAKEAIIDTIEDHETKSNALVQGIKENHLPVFHKAADQIADVKARMERSEDLLRDIHRKVV